MPLSFSEDSIGEPAIAQQLAEIARRIEANMPRHNDPEAFHSEKSQIAHDLRQIAREVGDGG